MSRKRTSESSALSATLREVLSKTGPLTSSVCGKYLPAFLDYLATRNYSPATIRDRAIALSAFFDWLAERGVTDAREVTRPMLERYQRWLHHYRQKSGKPLAIGSQIGRLLPVKAFFRWAVRQNLVLSNPASDLEMPRAERRLPKIILTAAETEKVLSVPDVKTVVGLRDRAMMEVLYSTGMRRMELAGLAHYDLHEERGVVLIRLGKGKKDRMCPMGERAFAWVRKYIDEARPHLLDGPDNGTLFLSERGEKLDTRRLSALVRDHIKAADLGKRGSCHLFRHTCATLMLENGADVRFIQQLLGHADLSTTQIYTQVSIRALKEVHTRTHPGKLTRDGENEPSAIDANGSDGVSGKR